MGMKNPGGEIVQVEGGHIVRATGRKDRHSKVFTAKGPRDRRVRLSAHTAIQFYDVQDRLGYDRPSKAVDWLIKNAQSAIDKLEKLPPWHPTDTVPDPQPDSAVPGSGNLDPDPPGGYGFHLGEASETHHSFPNYPQDNLGLSLYGGGGDHAPQTEQALFGFGPGSYQRMVAWHGQDVDGVAAFGGSNQRGTLQSSSSFSQMIRAWDDLPASVAAQRSQQQQQLQIQQQPSIFGTRFVSDGGGGFPVFCVPARIHGEDDGGGEGGHGVVYGRPQSPSSPNSTHR